MLDLQAKHVPTEAGLYLVGALLTKMITLGPYRALLM